VSNTRKAQMTHKQNDMHQRPLI